MCLLIAGEHKFPVNPESVVAALRELKRCGENFCALEKSPQEYLSIVWTTKRMAIIYVNHADPYTCFNASVTAEESTERAIIHVGSEPTPMPANMMLPPAVGKQVLREFCSSGKLSSAVWWIRDGQKKARENSAHTQLFQ